MKRKLLSLALTAAAMLSMAAGVQAADYSFATDGMPEYYPPTSYEEVYGTAYNYGGSNMIDYQIPELEYGSASATQTGVMEKTHLPGLQESVYTGGGNGGYGIPADGAYVSEFPEFLDLSAAAYGLPAYTSVDGMERSDGSIGTVSIPSLGIRYKLWEGETDSSMAKGLGHYTSSSGWDGNVCVFGHNRGSAYNIGAIKDLKPGDLITYETVHGVRAYAVETVEIISSTDWSYLQATSDNRITLTTCLANQPDKRVCVQGAEALP